MSKYEQTGEKYQFLLLGIVTSPDFQQSQFIINRLHKCYPKRYDQPEIRPMLDVEWNERILKLRRKLGSGLWEIQNNVAIFCNGSFFGDFRTLKKHLEKRYRFTCYEDWYCSASKQLMSILREKSCKFHQLVYFTIAVDDTVIGSLLFELYNDLVPLTCENFFKMCHQNKNGYVGTPMHRSVTQGWLQFGGYNLIESKMADENYVIGHDRRGVLSMCNTKKHENNSTQFFIALDKAPWMDYKYVAFGQLIQGDNVLKKIEYIPSDYQSPSKKIEIVKAGEFTTTWRPDDSKLYSSSEVENHVEQLFPDHLKNASKDRFRETRQKEKTIKKRAPKFKKEIKQAVTTPSESSTLTDIDEEEGELEKLVGGMMAEPEEFEEDLEETLQEKIEEHIADASSIDQDKETADLSSQKESYESISGGYSVPYYGIDFGEDNEPQTFIPFAPLNDVYAYDDEKYQNYYAIDG